MKVFHCDHCRQLAFFENVHCTRCDHLMAFLPDMGVLGSLEPVPPNKWRSPIARSKGREYRLCQNYSKLNICNWAIPADQENPFCLSCQLTRTIPNLEKPENKQSLFKMEVAKRRLIYTLMELGLPIEPKKQGDDQGLMFEFLEDLSAEGGQPVMTGHVHGVITINLAEADDAEREKRRLELHEPYRTLLGHFRHEVGHYYWDRLIANSELLGPYRDLFGDERRSYADALQEHYKNGPPQKWQDHFISTYASSHPWEDWAETWAHYLHIVDSLETAASCGLRLDPDNPDEPKLEADAPDQKPSSFDRMMADWFPLTYVLNNLNRGLGLADGYPFVLSEVVVSKLRFIHHAVGKHG